MILPLSGDRHRPGRRRRRISGTSPECRSWDLSSGSTGKSVWVFLKGLQAPSPAQGRWEIVVDLPLESPSRRQGKEEMQEWRGAGQRCFCMDPLRLPEISSDPWLRGQMKQFPTHPPALPPYSGSPCDVPFGDLLWDVTFQSVSQGREGTRLLVSLLSAEAFFQPESTDKLRPEKMTRNRKQNWKDLTWPPSPSPRSKVGSNLRLPFSCSPVCNPPVGAGRDYPDLCPPRRSHRLTPSPAIA